MDADVPITPKEVKRILDNAADLPWSLQGMGMFRHYLTRELRLHVWDMRFTAPRVSTVHTHPWDFTSHIYSGYVTDVRYFEQDRIDPKPWHTYYKQRILCGPGGGTDGDPEPCLLWSPERSFFANGRGGSYRAKAHEIHESIPKTGTVTVIRRTFHEDTEHALVYFRKGRTWVSAEPRTASREEVVLMRDMALDRWEDE